MFRVISRYSFFVYNRNIQEHTGIKIVIVPRLFSRFEQLQLVASPILDPALLLFLAQFSISHSIVYNINNFKEKIIFPIEMQSGQ